MEGTLIAGRYRLVRELGRGGMGAVWLAEHASLSTSVAVKLINAELANHPEARTRFQREAVLAARIRSVHVVQIHDHGLTDDGKPYIAMEYLVGESLSERLATRRRLTLVDTARIVSHVCRGVARAHDASLVHRDLKPENIFIAKEGSDEIAKVLDFGVAKATDALVSGAATTRTGAMLGTPHYMSPEQAQGLKTVDARSDLWSLGVVIYECLTGMRPFAAPALGPLIAQIMAAPITPPSSVAPDAGIPHEVDAWMARALARRPEDRFASAAEMSEAFCLAAGVVDSQLDRASPNVSKAADASGRRPEPSPMELDRTMAAPPPASTHDQPPVVTQLSRTDETAPAPSLAPKPRATGHRRIVVWLAIGIVLAGGTVFFFHH